MRKITYVTLSILVIILFLGSCKKNGGIPHYTIDADLKAAFNYKPGTYWIYRDSISGRIDSFAVRSNILSTGTIAGNYSIDGIEMNITEYNGGSITDTSMWSYNISINYEELIWYKNFLTVNYYFQFNPIFTYPFKVGPLIMIDGQYGNDAPNTTNIYTTYSLNGNSFTHVAEINNAYTSSGVSYYNDWFYVCPDIGYIKIRINDPYDSVYKVWEILRWNIVK